MKRLRCICILLFLFSLAYAQQAKYVFYFIGDGMGVNQVNGTEMYLAEQEGRIGVKPLLFTAFPITGLLQHFLLPILLLILRLRGQLLPPEKKHIMELLVWIMKGMSFKLLLNKRKGPVGK